MLIVLEPSYVNKGEGGPGAINMLIVPEPSFPYYSPRIGEFFERELSRFETLTGVSHSIVSICEPTDRSIRGTTPGIRL